MIDRWLQVVGPSCEGRRLVLLKLCASLSRPLLARTATRPALNRRAGMGGIQPLEQTGSAWPALNCRANAGANVCVCVCAVLHSPYAVHARSGVRPATQSRLPSPAPAGGLRDANATAIQH
jgi:hypothetical protein